MTTTPSGSPGAATGARIRPDHRWILDACALAALGGAAAGREPVGRADRVARVPIRDARGRRSGELTWAATTDERAPARLSIRVASPDELPHLHRMAERAVWELLAGHHYTDRQLAAARAVRGYHVEPELVAAGRYYVLEIDGVVVGGSGWSDGGGFHPEFGPEADESFARSTAAGTAVMRATYVDPAWARRGLATMLVQVTEMAATLAGFRRFEALCTPASEAMRRKLGYRVVRRIELPLTYGTSIAVARLRKELIGAPPAVEDPDVV